jgi:hypothetical protein
VTKILILGADGQIARVATHLLLETTDAERTPARSIGGLSSSDRWAFTTSCRASAILDPYRRSAAAIEATDLDYTIIRPTYVSRKSVADLIVKLMTDPAFGARQRMGVHVA